MARLDIDAEDKEKYAEQIGSILDYFAKLDAVDVEKVAPLDFITELKNVWREDVAERIFLREKVLAEAPEIEDGQIIVPQVLNK